MLISPPMEVPSGKNTICSWFCCIGGNGVLSSSHQTKENRLLQVHKTDDPGRAAATERAVPPRGEQAPPATGPELPDRLREAMVYAARWMGCRPVYAVCINRHWSMKTKSVTTWNERCWGKT